MNHVFTVFEHQTLTEADFTLDINAPTDFFWLIEKIEAHQLPCFTLAVQAGKVVIVVRHYLTVIRLPSGCILEILPKVSQPLITTTMTPIATMVDDTRQWVGQMLADIHNIKRQRLPMLSYSQNPAPAFKNRLKDNIKDNIKNNINNNVKNTATNHSPNQKSWLQPLAEYWFQLLTQLQLPRHYQPKHQNTPQAQGKLLIKQQLQYNHHRPHYRYTRQHELDLDGLWGQFFQTTLMALQSLPVVIPMEIQQIVIHLNQKKPLSALAVSQWQSSYHYLKQLLLTTSTQQDRLTREQLSQALEISWLILQSQSSILTNPILGQDITPAIMINMHQAFERWVTVKLQAMYQSKYRNKYQSKLHSQVSSVWLMCTDNEQIDEQINEPVDTLTTQEKRRLQPDILIMDDNGNAHIVADIKYKAINGLSDVSSNDLYQLCTYQHHWQASQAWLIYPKTKQFTDPIKLTRQVNSWQNNSDKLMEIYLVPFDLATGTVSICQ